MEVSEVRNIVAYAIKSNDLLMLSTILETQSSEHLDFLEIFYFCVSQNYSPIVKFLIKKGLNPNAVVNGVSLLDYAMHYGKFSVAEALLLDGAKPAPVICQSYEYITGVMGENKHRLLKLFLTHGCNPNVQHPTMVKYPLDAALERKQFRMAKILLECGANPRLGNNLSDNLEICATENKEELLDAILKKAPNGTLEYLTRNTLLNISFENYLLRKKYSRNCVMVLIKHSVLEDYTYEMPNYVALSSLNPYYEDCVKEVLAMKDHLLFDTDISLFSYIYKKTDDKLASLVMRLGERLLSEKFLKFCEDKFPIYYLDMYEKFSSGIMRYCSQYTFGEVLEDSVFDYGTLNVVGEICKHLSNEEIGKLRQKCHPSFDPDFIYVD